MWKRTAAIIESAEGGASAVEGGAKEEGGALVYIIYYNCIGVTPMSSETCVTKSFIIRASDWPNPIISNPGRSSLVTVHKCGLIPASFYISPQGETHDAGGAR